MEMMGRPVAGTYLYSVSGGNGRRDVVLGLADRAGKVSTLGEARRDGGRERAAGAVRVLRRDPFGGKPRHRGRRYQKVHAFRAFRMPPFMSTARQPKASR